VKCAEACPGLLVVNIDSHIRGVVLVDQPRDRVIIPIPRRFHEWSAIGKVLLPPGPPYFLIMVLKLSGSRTYLLLLLNYLRWSGSPGRWFFGAAGLLMQLRLIKFVTLSLSVYFDADWRVATQILCLNHSRRSECRLLGARLLQVTTTIGLLAIDLTVLNHSIVANHWRASIITDLQSIQIWMYHFISTLVCQLHSFAFVDDIFSENFIFKGFWVLVSQVDVLGLEHLVV